MVARVVHLLLGHLVDHLVGRHLVGRHLAEVGGKVVVEEVIHHLVGHLVGARG